MAEIDLKFMKGNKKTVKAMQTVWKPKKKTAKKKSK